jgi:hypothetical protein
LDSLFQPPSFYHGEKMWHILFSELVHEDAVQGVLCLVFLHNNENSDSMTVQHTIGCVKYKVCGEYKQKMPNANNFKGKDIGPDRLHADGIKKKAIKGRTYELLNLYGRKLPRRRYMMLPVEDEERCTFRCLTWIRL